MPLASHLPGVLPGSGPVSVIVPVYDAHDQLLACLESLAGHTPADTDVVLVDDCSPDPRIAPLLAAWADRDGRFRWLRTPRNLGFPGAANAGLAVVPAGHDVVWLNSDTRVSRGWLEGLQAALAADPAAGIACPLSNNGTILSVPRFNQGGPLPAHWRFEDFAADVQAAAAGRAPIPIPTAVGFCMYVRRQVVERLGGFDPAFGPGYGEECDYSLRAWQAGFRIVCAPAAVVHHEGAASFGGGGGASRLRRVNEMLLESRWPGYRAGVQRFCEENPLRELLEEVWRRQGKRQLPDRPRVLHVLHKGGRAGGIESHVADLAAGCVPVADATVLEPLGHADPWCDLRDLEGEAGVRRIALPAADTPAAIEKRFSRLLAAHRPHVVHCHHWLGWGTLALPRLAREAGCAVAVTVHDHFLLCPNYNFARPDGTACAKPAFVPGDGECAACLSAFGQQGAGLVEAPATAGASPVERLQSVFAAADRLIFPSRYLAERHRRVAGDAFDAKIAVLPHSLVPRRRDEGAGGEPPPRRSGDGPVRVTFLGAFTVAKGREVFRQAVLRLRGQGFVFTVMGPVPPDQEAALGAAGVSWSGPYGHDELAELLAGSDVVCVLPQLEEAYCLSFDEALGSGRIVIHTSVGAIAERASPDAWTIAVPPGDVAALVAALLTTRDRGLRRAIPVRRGSLRLPADQSGPYGDLYRMLARQARPRSGSAVAEDGVRPEILLEDGIGADRHQARVPRHAGQPAVASPRFDVLIDAGGPGADADALDASLEGLMPLTGLIGTVLVLDGAAAVAGRGPDGLRQVGRAQLAEALAGLGEKWLLCLRAGEILAGHWHGAVLAPLAGQAEVALAYWDDDLLTSRGERYLPRYRPGFDPQLWAGRPELWRGSFLVDRLCLVAAGGLGQQRTPLLAAANGWHRRQPGAVRHVPTRASHYLDRCHWAEQRVEQFPEPGPAPATSPVRLAALVLTSHAGHAGRVVNELLAQASVSWSAIQPVWLDRQLPAGLIDGGHPRVRPWRLAGSLAEALAATVNDPPTEWLLLVTDALNLERADTVVRLLAAADETTAVVGPRLLMPDSRVFAAGWLLGGGREGVVSGHGHGAPRQSSGYLGLLTSRRRVAAVSPVCALLRTRILRDVGLSAELRHFHVLTDLCLRARETGGWTLCAGDVDAFVLPHGQGPAGLAGPGGIADRYAENQVMGRCWGDLLAADPAHNPNLGLQGATDQVDERLPVPWHGLPPGPKRVLAIGWDAYGSGLEPLRALAEQGAIDYLQAAAFAADDAPSISELRRAGSDVLVVANPFHAMAIRALEVYRRHLPGTIVVVVDQPPAATGAVLAALAHALVTTDEAVQRSWMALGADCRLIRGDAGPDFWVSVLAAGEGR